MLTPDYKTLSNPLSRNFLMNSCQINIIYLGHDIGPTLIFSVENLLESIEIKKIRI